MGRRRRRVIRIVKKKLPTVFVCPRCGEEAVRVSIDKATGHATVACAICQLKDDFDAHPQAQAIDVYSYFTDRFYGVKEPRAIIPRDRHPTNVPTESAEEEEEEAQAEVEEPSRLTRGEAAPAEETFREPNTEADTQTGVSSSTEQAETRPESVETKREVEAPTSEEHGKSEEEEENPFGDILQSSDKEKKRYSSHPLEQESSTNTSSQ